MDEGANFNISRFKKIFAIVAIIVFIIAFYFFFTNTFLIKPDLERINNEGLLSYSLNNANPINVYNNIFQKKAKGKFGGELTGLGDLCTSDYDCGPCLGCKKNLNGDSVCSLILGSSKGPYCSLPKKCLNVDNNDDGYIDCVDCILGDTKPCLTNGCAGVVGCRYDGTWDKNCILKNSNDNCMGSNNSNSPSTQANQNVNLKNSSKAFNMVRSSENFIITNDATIYFQLLESENIVKHQFKIDSVGPDYITAIVFSNPIYIKLKVSEGKNYDLNADNYSDLYIRLNSINRSKINITMVLIHEKIEDPNQVNSLNVNSLASLSSNSGSNNIGGDTVDNGRNVVVLIISGSVVGILTILLVIIVILFFRIKNVEHAKMINQEKMKEQSPEVLEYNKRINELITQGYDSLTKRDIAKAKKSYEKIKEIYDPSSDKNKEVYNKVSLFFKTILKYETENQ